MLALALWPCVPSANAQGNMAPHEAEGSQPPTEARSDVASREPEAILPIAPRKTPSGRGRPGFVRGGGFGNKGTWVALMRMFYPPNPPPMGVEVMARGGNAPPMQAPDALKLFVADPFYAPLSTRLVERDLPEDLRKRANDYRRVRVALLSELRDVLFGLQGADGESRLAELGALARQQAAPLTETEAEAEALRQELIRVRAYGGTGDWNFHREWRLGKGKLKKPREEIALFEYQVLRAAVFYLEGFSPEQRLLLREIVMDLEDSVFRGESPPVQEFGFVFFSPHTARIRLPADTPSDLTERVQGYVAEKNELKQELRDLVYELERYMFTSSRTKACEALAEAQEERLGALEDLAEEIRHALTLVPGWNRKEMPKPLPADLEYLISNFMREKQRLQREYTNRLRSIRETLPPPAPGADESAKADWEEEVVQEAEKETVRFKKEVAPRIVDLDAQLKAIRAVVERVTEGELEVPYGGAADAFLTEFVSNRRSIESAFDYETAVLEPGLLPAQRRLLYAAAIERMGLPLPGAETQAAKLPGTMLK